MKEGPLKFPALRSTVITQASRNGNMGKGWYFGALAFLLTLSSIFLNAIILSNYEVLAPLVTPTLIIMVLGIWGLVIGFTAMTPRIGALALKISTPLILGFLAFIFLAGFLGVFGQASGFGVLGIPSYIAALYFAGIGVFETLFFQGTQAALMKYWLKSPAAYFVFYVMLFLMGILWHEAVGRQIIGGSITDAPVYSLYYGSAWVIFGLAFQTSRWIDSALGLHYAWNFTVSIMQAGVTGP